MRSVDSGGQETDYVTNYVATRSQIQTFDPKVWAQRFYATHGDNYDFINFIHVAGKRGNRFHFSVKNQVQGIGQSLLDTSAQYGSGGRLLGISVFPLSSLFDGADQGFSHETGHQWCQFLAGTPFAVGTPHWPLADVAANVMGFSIGGPGGQGGNFNFAFAPNGSGGYIVGAGNPLNLTTFNSMELYLMGLIPSQQVAPFFVLRDQTQSVTGGQTLQPSEIAPVTVTDVIGVQGARIPNSTQSQKNFRTANIVVSEQLLDARAMSLYDFFARRAEGRQQVTFASGLATGTCNPWYLATGGRSVMSTNISDSPTPTLATVNGNVMTPSGLGLRNAVVSIIDPSGLRRTATTSSFGVYSFDNIETGRTYTMTVASKRYRFAARVFAINSALSNVDFLGLE